MRTVTATVFENITVSKTITLEVHDELDPLDVETMFREEAFNTPIVDDKSGWDLVCSDGVNVEIEK